ncbi:MAG: hypothetical protein KDA52_04680 [Planctomycetaceae bacterium]|nr:hypothetical protein [Planctomycetaceae bacterium]
MDRPQLSGQSLIDRPGAIASKQGLKGEGHVIDVYVAGMAAVTAVHHCPLVITRVTGHIC